MLFYDRIQLCQKQNLLKQHGHYAVLFCRLLNHAYSTMYKNLHKNIVSSIVGKIPIKTEERKFGTKHTYHTKLIGKSGKLVSANVVVVIQKDSGKMKYKIVTLYSDKKEGKK